MFRHRRQFTTVLLTHVMILGTSALLLAGCNSGPTPFVVKHLRDTTGETISETFDYRDAGFEALDNSGGNANSQVQVNLERDYNHQINIDLNTSEITTEDVQAKIVELYKLPPNDPEGEEQVAKCPLSVMIPPGTKASITVEWIERWADGVINEGVEGQEVGQLGTFEVFLGYTEPCSVVDQGAE